MIIILKNKPFEMIIIKHEYAYMGYVFFLFVKSRLIKGFVN